MTAPAGLDFRRLWEEATPWSRFLNPEMEQASLWDGVARRVVVPPWALEAAAGGPKRYLVITEDWCGDAANSVPVLAGLVAQLPGAELRILPRDDYPEVMDHYLTNGARSIPIVIGLDNGFGETGHWGPRPAELQAWVMANRDTMPKAERYAQVRRWYVIDRGETTLKEILGAVRTTSRSPSKS